MLWWSQIFTVRFFMIMTKTFFLLQLQLMALLHTQAAILTFITFSCLVASTIGSLVFAFTDRSWHETLSQQYSFHSKVWHRTFYSKTCFWNAAVWLSETPLRSLIKISKTTSRWQCGPQPGWWSRQLQSVPGVGKALKNGFQLVHQRVQDQGSGPPRIRGNSVLWDI